MKIFDTKVTVHNHLDAISPLVQSLRPLVSKDTPACPDDLSEFVQLLNMVRRRLSDAETAYYEIFDHQQNNTETEDR